MTSVAISSYTVDAEDVEYYRHGKQPLLARLYKPRGRGPFPLVVELHGGAWVQFDRLEDTVLNEALARSGVVVAALDFRCPPDAAYPGSLIDINFAMRWLKHRSVELGILPEKVGLMGCSSGGHLAMLAAMRPRDPRYIAIPLVHGGDIGASVRCVVMCWPVIDPLGRYEYAKKLKSSGPSYPEFVDSVIPSQDQYWRSEAAMVEGSPVRALERGEKVEIPPVLYIQGTSDIKHPVPDLKRFIRGYERAGGRVELQMYEGEIGKFIQNKPESPNGKRALSKIIEFVHAELA